MIRNIWLGSCGRAASVVLLFTFALLGSGVHAQSAQSVPGGSLVKPVSPPAFLVAPSVSLGYSPTSMAAGTLTATGRTDLVTADSATGKITVFAGQGHGTFAPGVAYAAGTQPTSLVVADVDGDGRADVVLANPSEGVISVFPGNGDGTLGARKTYTIGFAPSLVAVGDFTGNGRLDVAVAGPAGKSLAILQNAGNGNLNRPVNFSLNSTPAAIIAADFNHDGHVDLAVASTTGTVSVFLGKGNGQFSALPDVTVASGALSSIAVSDFNRDGNPDLVITSATLNKVAVLLGHGDGKFAPATLLAVGNSPVDSRIADVDGDGIPDLIVINKGSNTFSVLNGVGDGTFKSATHFVVGNAPQGAAAADFYGNGRVDLVTINQMGQNLSVPSSNGDGTFAAARAYVAGVQPVSVASGDLTKSGRSDMVVASYCATDATCGGGGSAAILLAGPNGVYQLGSTYSMGTGSVAIHLVDVNGDGKLDMIALNRVDRTIALRLGAGDGSFGSLITIPLSGSPIALASGKLSNGGHADLAILEDCGTTSCSTPGQVEMLAGSGDGNFHTAGTYTVGFAPVAIAVGVTRTGAAPDVIVANRCGQNSACKSGGTASLLVSDGNGAFKTGPDIALGNGPSSIALANLHSTGVLDLVVSRSTDNTVAVLPGAGDGTFKTAVPYGVGNTPGALTIADFNGDGIPDVAVANTADSTVSVLFGTVSGTLQKSFAVPVSGNATGVAAIAGASKSVPASLATTNGSANAAVSSSNVTVLSNLQAQPQLAGGSTTTTTVTWTAGSQSPSTVNQSVSFTATVTGTAGKGAPTGGAVVFSSDGSPISDCGGTNGVTVTPGAGITSTAICPTSVLTNSAAGHAIVATYSATADLVYDTSTSSTLTQVVNALGPTVTLTPAPVSPSNVNTPVTFTASLTGVSLTPVTPSGTMTFAVGGTTVAACTQTVSAAGVAQCPISNLAIGVNNVTATYSGDPNFVAAAAGSNNYTIQKASPNVAVSPAPASPSAANTPVTFTAQLGGVSLTPIQPGGTITFTLNGSAATCVGSGTANVIPVSSAGAASCQIDDMPVSATNVVHAVYSGDANFNGASADSASYTVAKASPSVSFASTPPSPASPQSLNTAVTFTAQLTGVSLTPIPPGGTMTFLLNGSAATCTGSGTANVISVNASGAASCVIQNMPASTTNAVTANYSGDSSYSSATATSPSFTVNAVHPTISFTPVASPASPSALNTAVTFTAALTGLPLTPVIPNGKMTFLLNGSAATCNGSGTANVINVNSSGVASCVIQNMHASATNAVTATYGSDTNYVPAAAGSAPLYTITALPGTITVTSSVGANTTVGTSAIYTATVTASSVSPVAPAGPIAFSLNGTVIPTCAAVALNASQQAQCTINALVAPTDSITAAYSAADTNFTPVTTGQFVQSVAKASPTVALTATSVPTPPEVNEQVLFTATVSIPGSGTVQPSGSVTFTQGATQLCPPAVLNTAVTPSTATCTYSFPHVIANPGATITAAYSGDTNFTTGTNGTTSEIVDPANTTTVTASSGATLVNQAVTFTTTVASAFPGTTIPAGTVTFTTNASPAPTGTCTTALTLAANGSVPSCTFIFGASGSVNVFAVYHPSGAPADFVTSTSSTVTQVVNSGSVNVLLNSNPNPSSVNQTAVFTATFSPAAPPVAPTGTVTYYDGATAITNCNALNITVAANVSTIPSCSYAFTTATSTTVTHSIQAKYSGDSNYSQINSNSQVQVVDRTAVQTAINALGAPPSINQTVTLTATLTPSFTGTAVPTGTVTFNDTLNSVTTSPCANATVTNTGGVLTASCQTSFGSIGTHNIAAQYNGDANFVQGTATSRPIVVGQTSTTIGIISTPPPGGTFFVNESGGSITATVTPNPTGSVSPTGTMTFTDSVSGTTLCAQQTVAANGSGGATATCAMVFRSQGPHTITANYGGDTNFPTTSNTFAVTVNATATTTAVSSPGSVAANQAVTLTTTVTPTYPGSTIPKGSVSFATSPNVTPAPTGTCVAGVQLAVDGTVPTCTFIFPATGTFNITATFTPSDTNFATSASTAWSQSIGKAGAPSAVAAQSASIVNQSVTFSAAFTPAITGTQPTGTVTYYDGPTAISTCTAESIVTAGAIPNCTYSFRTAGAHSITLAYSGDVNFGAATSPVTTQTVNKATTAAVVASSTGSGATATSSVNQQVTFTATITPQIPNAALTIPSGTVSFYDNGDLTTPICQGAPVSPSSGGAATATCLYTFTAKSTNSISAAYSGDANFVDVSAGNSSPVNQNVVAPNTTVTVTPPPSAIVNQTVTYTVVVTPASTGATVPSGAIKFSDTDNKTIISASAPLTAIPAGGSSTTSVQITFVNAGSHTITASYAGDTNFTPGSGSATSLNVAPSATALTLTSGEPTSFATEKVTFVAIVTPTPNAGPSLQVPVGAVSFGSTDPTGLVAAQCPNAVPLTPVGDGTSAASCSVTFAHSPTPAGQMSVTASYADTVDSNFSISSSSTPQTVQDFNVAQLTAAAGNNPTISTANAVYLTQGSTTDNDIFGALSLSIKLTSSVAYNPKMTVTCEVYAGSNPASALTDPSCSPVDPQTVSIANGAGAQKFTIIASSSALTGKFTVRFTAYDPKFVGNSYFVEYPLYVEAPSASLSVASGATGTENVSFLAPGVSSIKIASFSCPQIWDRNNLKMMPSNANQSLIVCSAPSGTTLPETVNIVSSTATVPLSITAAAATTSQNQQAMSTTYLAGLLGVPAFAVLGWIGTRKSSRKNLLRFFGLILVLMGVSYVTGCGGNFTKTPVPTPPGIVPGSYLVQVIATDSSGAKYYAEVPIDVK